MSSNTNAGPSPIILGDAFSSEGASASHKASVPSTPENPFRQVGLVCERACRSLYEWVQPSGLGIMVSSWWVAYPSWCRHRHVNRQRYTKPQIQFRRKWFSENIPTMVNPSEKRAVMLVLSCCVFLRAMNSIMFVPFDAPEEAYAVIK